MKKFVAIILVLSFIVQPILAEYVDLKLSYPTNVEKGEETTITFEIINQSNDRLWDGTILIEESFMNKYRPHVQSSRDYQNNPFKFSIVEPGQNFKETFVLTFSEDIPLKEVRFNIILKCGKGACRGGCRPYYLEKTVNIVLSEKRAEAILKLNTKEFTVYRGDTLEIPFTLENIGDIQMTDIKVEIKGDITSDEIVNIPYLTPGKDTSGNLIVSIDENTSNMSLNPIVVAKFQDPGGRGGMVYEDIIIKVIEKEKEIEESNTSEVDTEIIKEAESPTPGLLYFFLFLSIVAIILVIIFLLRLFKR